MFLILGTKRCSADMIYIDFQNVWLQEWYLQIQVDFEFYGCSFCGLIN